MSVDASGFQRRIEEAQRRVRAEMDGFAEEVQYLFHAYVEEHFEEGSASGDFSNSKKIHANTGASTRSYLPGQPGNVSEVKITPRGLSMRYGTTLIHLRIHEDGGFIRSKGKMEAFFWAMYMKTRREFYRIMALSVEKKGGVTIPPRPFHTPALKTMQTEGAAILLRRLSQILRMAVNDAATRR